MRKQKLSKYRNPSKFDEVWNLKVGKPNYCIKANQSTNFMYHASIFCYFPMSYYISTISISCVFKTCFYKETQSCMIDELILQDNNMNCDQEVENLISSSANLHGFIPMFGDNFSNNHQYHHHQSSLVYDPMINHFPTMIEMFGVQRDSTIPPRVDSFMNISDPPVFDPAGFIGEIKSHGGKKRKKIDESSQVEKPREVVHVRAKRGEATDSHSLAERMRREKINEKLRRLQDLVPGCYKTMGMSVMLDVIINYVQSLQNQIEFLSMKLTAASMFYDFNSTDMDDMGAMKGTNGHEAQMMERMVGEGYGGDFAHF